VWICEVADAMTLRRGVWDQVCHEHLTYWDERTFQAMCHAAGLNIQRMSKTMTNGGSLLFHVVKDVGSNVCFPPHNEYHLALDSIKMQIVSARAALLSHLHGCEARGDRVHLLGASTKANTWLQYCAPLGKLIQFASDRDPRKIGHVTPGTNIPIVSEEESRAMKPDVYVVGPWHFKREIVAREKAFLERGGQLVFPLPKFEVIKR
jgi:NDP-4-keto-2,6-dideoxyhexose 3-C-methyltransferase